jgi:hypothetical protein
MPLFTRYISAPQRPWLRVGLGALLILIALGITALADPTSDLRAGKWRALFISPAVITYILLIVPAFGRTDERVITALRPLLRISDAEFNRLTDKTAYIRASYELAAYGAGFGFGLIVALSARFGFTVPVATAFWLVMTCAMYALLAWLIYAAIAGSRMTTALYRQPMSVNVLDTGPFETVGRQSLLLALAFIGGITLSLVISGVQPESLQAVDFWLSYAPIIAAPVVIFFLNMLATHRALADAKQRALADARRQLEGAGRDLVHRLAEQQDTGTLAATVAALIAYEHRLTEARTWPYNTAMLRTLFLSLLLPIGTSLLQMLWRRLFP